MACEAALSRSHLNAANAVTGFPPGTFAFLLKIIHISIAIDTMNQEYILCKI